MRGYPVEHHICEELLLAPNPQPLAKLAPAPWYPLLSHLSTGMGRLQLHLSAMHLKCSKCIQACTRLKGRDRWASNGPNSNINRCGTIHTCKLCPRTGSGTRGCSSQQTTTRNGIDDNCCTEYLASFNLFRQYFFTSPVLRSSVVKPDMHTKIAKCVLVWCTMQCLKWQ